jgi:hypothetical protein
MNEHEIRARALDAAIAMLAALPEKEKIAMLSSDDRLTPEAAIVGKAMKFARYIADEPLPAPRG